MADLHSKILNACPLGPIFFIFMQCLSKFGQIIGCYGHQMVMDTVERSIHQDIKTKRKHLENITDASSVQIDPGQGDRCSWCQIFVSIVSW